ncbi:hypothetical protein Tco_0964790 [Tanacetum coccineum]
MLHGAGYMELHRALSDRYFSEILCMSTLKYQALRDDAARIPAALGQETLFSTTRHVLIYVCTVQILNKKMKTKPIRTNPGTRLEECKKTKPKAYLSLMDQPVPILLGQIQGLQMIAWVLVKNQGLGLEDWDAPQALDPSFEGYIRRPPHTA